MHSSFSSVSDLVPMLDTVSFLRFVFQIVGDHMPEYFLSLESGFSNPLIAYPMDLPGYFCISYQFSPDEAAQLLDVPRSMYVCS